MLSLLAQMGASAQPAAAVATENVNVPAPAPPRGQLRVGFGLAGGASNWSGDGLGYAGFDLGLRIYRVVTFRAGLDLGYARVDQRVLTRLELGFDFGWTFAQRVRPHVGIAFVHQHEESLAALAQQPLGAVLGIGTGIRHRAGIHSGLGLEIIAARNRQLEFGVGPDASFMWLTYSSGPTWYWTLGVTAALHVRLW